jgi:hypothetical protein
MMFFRPMISGAALRHGETPYELSQTEWPGDCTASGDQNHNFT